jgi:copper chaperone NosL
MRRAISWISVTCLCLVLFSYSAAAQDPGSSQREKCPVCGMFVSMYVDWSPRIEFKDLAATQFCGPKCMFKYCLDTRKGDTSASTKAMTAIFVKDYYSKVSIDALQAFYVVWSDIYGPMGHEPIPFGRETDAKRFLKEHKGKKLLRFKDISLSLINSLDNPP